jgi:hypothetical protein
MDSKNIADPRLADLVLSTYLVCAAVQDIPGASIDSGNVELDLSKFDEEDEATVVLAEFGTEVASVSVASGVATLDFTSGVTASDVVKIYVKKVL